MSSKSDIEAIASDMSDDIHDNNGCRDRASFVKAMANRQDRVIEEEKDFAGLAPYSIPTQFRSGNFANKHVGQTVVGRIPKIQPVAPTPVQAPSIKPSSCGIGDRLLTI